MKELSAIILAGGFGTRLRSVVSEVPKPMAPINGRPFLEYQMDYWIEQGVSDFILAVGYLYQNIISHFGSKYSSARIRYVIEEQPLGTGGALLLAIKEVNKYRPFLLLNGDTFFEVDLKELINFHNKNRSDWTFSLFRNNESGRYMSMNINEDGRILLKSSSINTNLSNGGVYLIDPAVLETVSFDDDKKYSLEDEIFKSLYEAGLNSYGCEFPGFFIDIGVPDDYFKANQILKSS